MMSRTSPEATAASTSPRAAVVASVSKASAKSETSMPAQAARISSMRRAWRAAAISERVGMGNQDASAATRPLVRLRWNWMAVSDTAMPENQSLRNRPSSVRTRETAT